MKSRFPLVLALVMGAALLPRGAAAQPTTMPDTAIFGGGWAHDVAVDAGSNRVYATATYPVNTPRVAVIDGGSNTVIATVRVGLSPLGVAVNLATSRVYVTGRDSDNVTVIDGATNTVMATVPVGLSPVGVAVNPTTNLIYVANWEGDSVSVIDGGSNTVVATVPAGDWPYGVAVDPATNRIYVTNAAHNGTVSVIDGGSNTVVATIPVGSLPLHVAVNPATNRIYVASSVIDGQSNAVVATLPWGSGRRDVAVNPATNRIYVAADRVWVIDGATNSVLYSLRTAYGAMVGGVAVNPATGLIYVTACGVGCWVEALHDSPGAAPPATASPTPPPAATPTACPPAPAPLVEDGMEWVALQCGTCNAVTATYPDSTPVGIIAGAVAPPETLRRLWEFEGGTWRGWSAAFPQASDLTEVDRLDVVFVCVDGAATFTRPVI